MYAMLKTDNYTLNELGVKIYGASYWICDAAPDAEGKDPDIDNLPTTDIGTGSKALCIQSGNIYIFGPSKSWVKYKGVSIMN